MSSRGAIRPALPSTAHLCPGMGENAAMQPARSRLDGHGAMLVGVGLLVIAVAAGAFTLWPDHRPARAVGARQQDPTRIVDAVVTKVTPRSCEKDEQQQALAGSTCSTVAARRADNQRTVTFDFTDQTGLGIVAVGRRVKLSVLEQPGQPPFYNIVDLERGRPMLLLTLIFVAAVVAFGRWQGVRSLIGLIGSFIVIVGFIVPAILDNRSPIAVALVGSLAIMIASLYLSHGLARKTTAAVVGTALALGLTAALALVFVRAASLTGLASEEALNANFQVGGLSLRGLLLAGIIIGGLGVLDDVTMSQASLVFALRRANPAAPFTGLVRASLTVGRDHIAATVNTLFLAYAGASLPLLILFATSGESLASVATSEVVAVEIVRTLCGSIGLIAAVPLTTVLAAALARDQPAREPEPARHREREARSAQLERRLPYTAASELDEEGIRRLWALALETFGSSLSHAIARAPGSSRTHHLDLTQPQRLEALWRHGSSDDAAVYVRADSEPVLEVAQDPLGQRPRLSLRLTPDELERVVVGLRRWGLPSSLLVPQQLTTGSHAVRPGREP
jgi:uncharacterized membrane protein